MKRAALLLAVLVSPLTPAGAQSLRPPAVPLVTHDPYFSVWSMSDTLSEDQTRHWTGTVQSLYSAVRVDGKTYRLMGREIRGQQGPVLEQKTLSVWPTRTIYTFAGAGIAVTLTFMTPAFPDDLDVLSRPVTYLTGTSRPPTAGRTTSRSTSTPRPNLAVNTAEQPVTWGRFRLGAHTVLRAGSVQQPVLEKVGDNLRIDWGYLYAVAPARRRGDLAGDRDAVRASFAESGSLPDRDDFTAHRVAGRRGVSLAFAWNLSGVAAQPVLAALHARLRRRLFDRVLQPEAAPVVAAERRGGRHLLTDAMPRTTTVSAHALRAVRRRADGGPAPGRRRELRRDRGAGLPPVARRAQARRRRQRHSRCSFSKENFTNGCIATVDVIYPTAPHFLLFSPALAKASLAPLLDYAELDRAGSSRSRRTTWAPTRRPTARSTAAASGPRKTRCRSRRAATCSSSSAAIAKIEGNADFAEQLLAGC